jgi:hypothetical protein
MRLPKWSAELASRGLLAFGGDTGAMASMQGQSAPVGWSHALLTNAHINLGGFPVTWLGWAVSPVTIAATGLAAHEVVDAINFNGNSTRTNLCNQNAYRTDASCARGRAA